MKRFGLRHKFNSIRTECDGISFPSRAEAARYLELKKLRESGDVFMFLRQVPFHLSGGEEPVKYVCDFLVFWSDGSCTVEEVKGFETAEWKIKKKLVEDQYGIHITVIKKR